MLNFSVFSEAEWHILCIQIQIIIYEKKNSIQCQPKREIDTYFTYTKRVHTLVFSEHCMENESTSTMQLHVIIEMYHQIVSSHMRKPVSTFIHSNLILANKLYQYSIINLMRFRLCHWRWCQHLTEFYK